MQQRRTRLLVNFQWPFGLPTFIRPNNNKILHLCQDSAHFNILSRALYHRNETVIQRAESIQTEAFTASISFGFVYWLRLDTQKPLQKNSSLEMKRRSLEKLFNTFKQQTIAVIGDVMLDKYIFGHVSRISPEAPVPVIDVLEESFRLGGAANVAMNIHSLSGNALLFGVCGEDEDSKRLIREMEAQGFSPDSLIKIKGRPTTCKTRVIAHNHHIVRIDSETREQISSETENRLIENLQSKISDISAIIFEDYNKGVLTASLIKRVTELSIKHNIPVLVDPKKNFFFDYQNCTVFKPNLKEISEALGHSFRNTDEDIELACKMLGEKIRTRYIVLTRGEKGISVFNETLTHLPSVALEVADVSGAGDTVIAVLTLGLASGLDIVDAARVANFAAGLVCAEVGAVSVDRDKLFSYCMEHF